jgi:hypothetical protein
MGPLASSFGYVPRVQPMKAESWKIRFSSKRDVMRVKNSPVFEDGFSVIVNLGLENNSGADTALLV